MVEARIVPAGDSAWLIELPERIDVEVNERAIQIAKAIERLSSVEPPSSSVPVRDIVVGYRSVMVFVDPLDPRTDGIERRLREIADAPGSGGPATSALVDVPVCYEGAYALDIGAVAAFASCTPAEVIELHLSREYRVFVAGFVPGFAYMAAVDPRIAAPRHSTPRLRVPAGSVAVAAGQTGVYPAETPGGWNVIGRSPVRPYDPDRASPFLFRPGDRVRFHRITEEEYRASSQWEDV